MIDLLEDRTDGRPTDVVDSLKPGGNMVPTGGKTEPKHWRNDPKARVVSTPKPQGAPEYQMAAARAAASARSAKEARQAEQQRQQARAYFEQAKKDGGADFDRAAAEEYYLTYASEGGRLTTPTPHEEEMGHLLKEHVSKIPREVAERAYRAVQAHREEQRREKDRRGW